ncbi:MAG: sensor histidine kinase [Gemmatimonadaceae bacterium]
MRTLLASAFPLPASAGARAPADGAPDAPGVAPAAPHGAPGERIAPDLLLAWRDRAERQLNLLRAIVLALLAAAAVAYGPSLTPALNRTNVFVLLPALVWTAAQYLLFYRRPVLPAWLSVVNPVVDVTGVTAIIGAYASASSASLALKTPIFLAYFVILAARPVASSRRAAAAAAALAVAEYVALLAFLVLTGRLALVASPVAASGAQAVSPLDEGAKVLFLIVTGAIVTYASRWHEQLAASYSRAHRERAQLEAELARAELQRLKLQLHPHFLFNTLNAITALIAVDPSKAEQMVAGLSHLLRLSLRSATEPEVSLERELEVLGHYTAIQQIRFQDRLTVHVQATPEARGALVPALVLQPLVENAIKHGITPRAAPGRVEVHAERWNDMLRLRVSDDGVGTRGAPADGIGLANTRARLRTMYGERHRFVAGGSLEGGFAVEMEIPFRAAGAASRREA